MAVPDMPEHIGYVVRQKTAVALAVVRELEEELTVSVVSFKKGRAVQIPLRKEGTLFFGVTGLGPCLNAP